MLLQAAIHALDATSTALWCPILCHTCRQCCQISVAAQKALFGMPNEVGLPCGLASSGVAGPPKPAPNCHAFTWVIGNNVLHLAKHEHLCIVCVSQPTWAKSCTCFSQPTSLIKILSMNGVASGQVNTWRKVISYYFLYSVEIAVQICKRDSTQYLQEDLVSLNCLNCVNLSGLDGTLYRHCVQTTWLAW